MKNILPIDLELKQIDDSLKNKERIVLWLSIAALSLTLAMLVSYGNEEVYSIKKESPKRELQADHY